MLAFEFVQLSALGLTPALANRAARLTTADGATFELLRITVVHRSTVAGHDGRAERSARPLPRLTAQAQVRFAQMKVGPRIFRVPCERAPGGADGQQQRTGRTVIVQAAKSQVDAGTEQVQRSRFIRAQAGATIGQARAAHQR